MLPLHSPNYLLSTFLSVVADYLIVRVFLVLMEAAKFDVSASLFGHIAASDAHVLATR
jgi:hypothetical protein